MTRHRVPRMEGIDEAKSPVEQLVLLIVHMFHLTTANSKHFSSQGAARVAIYLLLDSM